MSNSTYISCWKGTLFHIENERFICQVYMEFVLVLEHKSHDILYNTCTQYKQCAVISAIDGTWQ